MANIITVPFTYTIADDYLAQTTSQNKTANWVYKGPDKIWVYIDAPSYKGHHGHYYTEDDGGHDLPERLGTVKVFIDAREKPLIATLMGACENNMNYDYHDALPQYTEELPDGEIYQRPLHPMPDHTYNVWEMVYNPEADDWVKPYPLKQPHVTWANIRHWRDSQLRESDGIVNNDDVPDHLVVAWKAHRQKLKDIPQIHGAVNAYTTFDLTAVYPVNQADSAVIQVADITDIKIGMVVHSPFGSTDLFAHANGFENRVVGIDVVKRQVTISKELVGTPSEGNKSIIFKGDGDTHPWKIQPYEDPTGFK